MHRTPPQNATPSGSSVQSAKRKMSEEDGNIVHGDAQVGQLSVKDLMHLMGSVMDERLQNLPTKRDFEALTGSMAQMDKKNNATI
ncbi:hypothetical protein ACLKA6_019300 [Drosophila palustris]